MKIQESSINQKSNNTMSVTLCTVATFVKKNCLVARLVLFHIAGLHPFTFRILEQYPSKDIKTCSQSRYQSH